ncbi:outer membrane lipoprotein-sorting protein [Halobacterium sp. R2-5]|uniref:outer membrane lipoprotein-sorting protein n=1 Tax=Halobacterium sp. R2-5 TaxID=2715751 RepID=UPI00142226D3|nr:outer membrane lipoprotein-sorting protein [Halobacterium sp. R2-5]NIB98961.1 outer membrane lipoprotein-sorting protein [Halobacterium sp. R2-5]
MQVTRRRAATVVALAVITLTAGCSAGLSADGSVDADAVGDTVEQRYAALNGYDATITRTVSVGDSVSEARASVAVRGEQREVRYTAGPYAGETATGSADGPVFGAAGVDAPAADSYGALAEALVRTSDVSVERVTTYDGHRTAVVELSPESNATDAQNLTRTVWVDLDREIPLKVVTSWTTAGGQPASVTVTYDDVTLYENASASAEVSA